MLISCHVVGTFAVGVMVLSAHGSFGQDYPNKPIRIITSALGGAGDFASRQIAQGLTGIMGQQVIVDNRGIIAIEMAAKAPPDGYTLLVYGSPLWLSQFLRENVSWDVVRDFAPVTLAIRSPNILALHPSVPVTTVKNLIALAKSKPGELNYATASTGSSTHLAAELFKSMAGVNIVRVSYKGAALVVHDLLGGHVQMTFGNATQVTPHLRLRKLRALAVTSANPSVVAPGLPTVAASGVPGYESTAMVGMFAPGKMPTAIITQLNQAILRVLSSPDVKQVFINEGGEATWTTPEDLAASIKSEMSRLGQVIKEAGIRE